MKKIIATTLAVISLISCAPNTKKPTGSSSYRSANDNSLRKGDDRDIKDVARDDAITAGINAKYMRDDLLKVRDINVTTYKGDVQLIGKVKSYKAKLRAIGLAESTKGVISVHYDHLRVGTK
jgi:osmotically-inducible protein OsmY